MNFFKNKPTIYQLISIGLLIWIGLSLIQQIYSDIVLISYITNIWPLVVLIGIVYIKSKRWAIAVSLSVAIFLTFLQTLENAGMGAIPVVYVYFIITIGLAFIFNSILKKWFPDNEDSSKIQKSITPVTNNEDKQNRKMQIISGLFLAVAYPILVMLIQTLAVVPLSSVFLFLMGPNPAQTPINKYFLSVYEITTGLSPFTAVGFILLGFWFFPYFLRLSLNTGKKVLYVIAYVFAPFALAFFFALLFSIIYFVW